MIDPRDQIVEDVTRQSFADVRSGLWGRTRMTEKIKQKLDDLDVLQVHKPIWKRDLRKQFKKQNAKGPLVSVQVDLMDVHQVSRHNQGITFLLIIVDVYSRYWWVSAIKNKTKESIGEGMRGIFNRMKSKFGKTPENVSGDGDFEKRWFQEQFTEFGFNLHTTDSGEKFKTGMVERSIRTLRDLIKRYTSLNRTETYLNVLPDLVFNYNNTRHSRTGTTPFNAITGFETPKVKANLPDGPPDEEFLSQEDNKRRKDRGNNVDDLIGKLVRVLLVRRQVFDKGNKPTYSSDVYEVIEKVKNRYRVMNVDTGEVDTKLFGRHQLQVIRRETHREVVNEEKKRDEVDFTGDEDKNEVSQPVARVGSSVVNRPVPVSNQPTSVSNQSVRPKEKSLTDFMNRRATEKRQDRNTRILRRQGITKETQERDKNQGSLFFTDELGRSRRKSRRRKSKKT